MVETADVAADEHAEPPSERAWVLWRQDDHGNTVRVRGYAQRHEAEAACRDFTARGHHQHYWVEADDA